MTTSSKWVGSTEKTVLSGEAVFKVDGVEYRIRLESFADFRKISAMLDAEFRQGKRFAAQAVRSHVERALAAAE